MTNLSLFPSAVALAYGRQSKKKSQEQKTHQMAYLELLGAVLERPVHEVAERVTHKVRKQSQRLES